MGFVNEAVEWLDKSALRLQELLGDLAAMSDSFIIDGDSLILETLQHAIVDWSGSAGEYLQVVYLIDEFLHELQKRGANFRLVFFKLTQVAFWASMPTSSPHQLASPQSILLLRNAILNHLTYNTTLEVLEFDDWYCADFETFLSETRPSFALVSPCARLTTKQRTEDVQNLKEGIPISLVMAMMSLKIFTRSVALAFLPETQFKDRHIWAESVQPFKLAEHTDLCKKVEAEILPFVHDAYNKMTGSTLFPVAQLPSSTEFPAEIAVSATVKQVLASGKSVVADSDAVTDLVSSLAEHEVLEMSSWRYIIAAVSTHFLLKNGKKSAESETLAKAFLVATVLSNHLAPHLRPRRDVGSVATQPKSFHIAMDELTTFVARITTEVAASTAVSSREWDVADIIDTRLILSVSFHLQHNPAVDADALGFNADMTSELNALWEVATDANEKNSLFPIKSSFGISQETTNKADLELAKADLIPIRSAMVDSMMQVEGERAAVKETDYTHWEVEEKEVKANIAKYAWKESSTRVLEFSKYLYYDKEYEERGEKGYSTHFQAAWSKRAASMDARPTQTPVLQPKVLMKDESTAQQALERLQARLETEFKPKTALNDTREKEVARVKTLVNSWRTSPMTKRIYQLAQFTPTTAAGHFEWLYALLDVHIEQYRILKLERENDKQRASAAEQTLQSGQQRLKAIQRDEVYDQCVTMIVQCAVGMLDFRGSVLLDPTSAVMKRLIEILDQLGLRSLHTQPGAAANKASATASGGFPAGEESMLSASRFQLTRMGPWMKRDVGAVQDPRASRLLDSWQIDVLNCIDSYKSCLVVAPTSAGKSFMGFHAMSRVLETESGILVYVAPTKALVDQVVSEVFAKFAKVAKAPGSILCGAFTREMRIVPTNCRILVTVPQCLEILLLSRGLAGPGGWRSNLRWVIFDEIHCINMGDGAVWERLLPLVPCPFMALSATVGDVENFSTWLGSLAEAKAEYQSERPQLIVAPKKEEASSAPAATTGKPGAKPLHPKLAAKLAQKEQGGKGKGGKGGKNAKNAKDTAAAAASSADADAADGDSATSPAGTAEPVELFPGFVKEPFKFIQYSHRYSDLYKYLMIPRFYVDEKQFDHTSARPENLTQAKVQILSELRSMHPWMGLLPERFLEAPPTSAFTPKECLQVYEAMAKFAHLATTTPPQLKLEKALSADAVEALLALKPERFFNEGSIIDQRMMRLYETAIKQAFYDWCHDYQDLASLVLKELTGDVIQEVNNATAAGIPLGKDLGNEQFLLESLPNFVEVLREQSWLPAIVFNFDPQFCEKLAIALNATMIEREQQWRTSSEYRNARLKYAEAMKEYEVQKKRMERGSKKKDKRNDEDAPKDGDQLMEEPVDPDWELAEGTTFTRDGEVEPVDDLKAELTSLKLRGVNGLLVDAIRRGIGVHHVGLHSKYRQAVEHHFRTGQIKIVFATETLALGMNMPCRATVFAGDSPNLTPLQYRQMSGRAGRRGYDPLGRVIFWGVPVHRVTYLEGAKLAPIRGQFPLSTSFNLRGLLLSTADLTGSKKKRRAGQQEASEPAAEDPKAKKGGAAAAAKAKKGGAAAAKKAAAEPVKEVKDSWADSSDEEEEDEALMVHRRAKATKAVKKAPAKDSWDDSSDEEEDTAAAEADAEPEVEDTVVVPAEKIEPPVGTTEIFKSMKHVFTHSLYIHQFPSMQSQLDIHTQCSLQYLTRLGLATPLGRPQGLAGLAAHLNWAEPANLVLARFLSSPIMHELIQGWPLRWEEKVDSVLLFLAHLFNRVPVPPHRAGFFQAQLQDRLDNPKHSALNHCNHSLFLDPLPASWQKIIDDHNKECLEILNTVILPYAKAHKPFDGENASNDEEWLQLSQLDHLNMNRNSSPEGGLFQAVVDGALPVVARSPLAALGGHGDLFTTQADLRTMREGIAAADFGLLLNEDIHGKPQPLNSYIVDLYRYSNYEWLKKNNMFDDLDLYMSCNEFLVNLKSLRTALLESSKEPQKDFVLHLFSKMAKEFELKFNSVFKIKSRQYFVILVRGVEGYAGDLAKHILMQTRISVLSARKMPTAKQRQYVFKVACRTDNDKNRLTDLFSSWANDGWWIDNEESDDEDEDLV